MPHSILRMHGALQRAGLGLPRKEAARALLTRPPMLSMSAPSPVVEAIGRLEILVLDVESCPCYRCRRRRRSLTWLCSTERARAGESDSSTVATGSARELEGQELCGPPGALAAGR